MAIRINQKTESQKQAAAQIQRKDLMQSINRTAEQKSEAKPQQTGARQKQNAGVFKSGSAKISVSTIKGSNNRLSLSGSAPLDTDDGETLDELVV